MYYRHLVLSSFILSEHSDLTVCYSSRQYDFITFPQHFFAAGFIISYPAGNRYCSVYSGANFIYAGISALSVHFITCTSPLRATSFSSLSSPNITCKCTWIVHRLTSLLFQPQIHVHCRRSLYSLGYRRRPSSFCGKGLLRGDECKDSAFYSVILHK